MKINEILTLDLDQDIKNVIDLEDLSEQEIKEEIENYIITEGLAKNFDYFLNTYLSNISETGVWISGFYGSGKSYFGKIVGYLLSNKNILGTPARDRILQRFTGLNDEALLKNTISKLNSVDTRVVFLDVAKQDTSKGFAYTLFKNLLKTFDLPQNEHGYLLFKLMIDDNQTNVKKYIFEKTQENWEEVKNKMLKYANMIKDIYIGLKDGEDDYNNIIETIRREIDEFDAAKLQNEIKNYLDIQKEEKIVFIFDETSEAINQGKFTLLDIEGVSEALSALGNKVWTIAIAQEKLDDVINNSNVSKAQLTKVTDRFKTKIHLEATEVDQIIKSRLLKKTDKGIEELKNNFNKHSGQIADHSHLLGAGIEKTDKEESYLTYYPFYKYQFDLMQNFLFGTKGYVSTKIAARGMIITTFDILRKQVQEEELFRIVTGWQIAKEAQPSPPVRLVNRYDNAERILREKGIHISGRKLLETINFLSEAELTKPNLENIIKSFINEPNSYHTVKEEIKKSLLELVEGKMLLLTQGIYNITSDVEQRLLDEMTGYTVQGFIKKKIFVEAIKNSEFIKNIARIIDNGIGNDFYITTDNDDELTSPSNKALRIKIKSIYNLSDDRTKDIESLKIQYQSDKDLIWLVPENDNFYEIDKLIDEVERISYLEQKYNDPNSEEGKILIKFLTEKNEKQNRISELIEFSLRNGDIIYLFNVYKLDENNYKTIINKFQRELIANVYAKRLTSQLSDNIAKAVIKESTASRLSQYFHGDDFKFFDANGNFIGENLKVCEEILYKIRNTFVDGKTIEIEMEKPPTGFAFGTVITTIAALMRAGKVIAKYNGEEKFSWRDTGVIEIFSAAREFRKASFKAVSKSLSLQQRQEIAQFLLDIEASQYINKNIDYNTNDFELVNAIRDLAKYFADKIASMKNNVSDFNRLFPESEKHREILLEHTGTVNEANYIDKANIFLTQKEVFLETIEKIKIVEKFIEKKLPKAKRWREFALAVIDELRKSAQNENEITALVDEFEKLYNDNLVNNFEKINRLVQKIKDRYYELFNEAAKICAVKYSELKTISQKIIDEISKLPEELKTLNENYLQKAKSLKQYAEQRAREQIELDFDVKDKNSRFTYSEVLSFIDLYERKKSELEILRSSLITEKPKDFTLNEASKKKHFTTKIPSTKMKILEYKKWLLQELEKFASANDDDEITLE